MLWLCSLLCVLPATQTYMYRTAHCVPSFCLQTGDAVTVIVVTTRTAFATAARSFLSLISRLNSLVAIQSLHRIHSARWLGRELLLSAAMQLPAALSNACNIRGRPFQNMRRALLEYGSQHLWFSATMNRRVHELLNVLARKVLKAIGAGMLLGNSQAGLTDFMIVRILSTSNATDCPLLVKARNFFVTLLSLLLLRRNRAGPNMKATSSRT